MTKEDVWGEVDHETIKVISNGIIVARGVSQFGDDEKNQNYPTICPVFGDEMGYKDVTVICQDEQFDEVEYWLEYVHGVGCIAKLKTLEDGRIAIRSEYQCW